MRPIDAGRLTRPITVLRDGGTTRDEYNEPVEGWAAAPGIPDPVMAEVIGSTGSERFQSGEKAAQAPATFRFRWMPTFAKVTDRLLHDGRQYDIRSIAEIGRREGYEVIATARGDL